MSKKKKKRRRELLHVNYRELENILIVDAKEKKNLSRSQGTFHGRQGKEAGNFKNPCKSSK